MAKFKLYNYADPREGRVLTKSWGSCQSPQCPHPLHDSPFEYPVTLVEGDQVWRGECGERLVVSFTTGRLFYTEYCQSSDPTYAPWVGTFELTNGVPGEVWDRLIWYHERHVVMQTFKEALRKYHSRREVLTDQTLAPQPIEIPGGQ